jgi:hypothetical protein
MKTCFVSILVGFALLGLCLGQSGSKQAYERPNGYTVEDSIRGAKSYKPKAGFIPDAATAAKVAEAILIPIYGEQNIIGERPFKATLKGNTWTVAGTLPSHLVGGTAIVKLSKLDGRVLFVTHTQ